MIRALFFALAMMVLFVLMFSVFLILPFFIFLAGIIAMLISDRKSSRSSQNGSQEKRKAVEGDTEVIVEAGSR